MVPSQDTVGRYGVKLVASRYSCQLLGFVRLFHITRIQLVAISRWHWKSSSFRVIASDDNAHRVEKIVNAARVLLVAVIFFKYMVCSDATLLCVQYENHSLPKVERTSLESSRHSHHHHHHPASHSEQEQSKGQPPPLVSPHRSSSKGSSDTAIFRPFEKDGPTSSASVVSHSDKSQSTVLVPPPKVGSSGKCNHVSASSAKEVSTAVPASVRVFGSTPEAKILNSNFINHRIEKFDFKSLARECASREASSSTAAVVEGSTSSSKAVSAAATTDVEENGLASLAPQLPSLASLPSVTVVAPAVVVSRLDARERLLREARAEGSYNSESEEECELEEEMDRKRDRLTVVGSLVAADLMLTPCKVALFDRLGLTTLQRKKGECPGRSPVRNALPASVAEASISFLHHSGAVLVRGFCSWGWLQWLDGCG